MRFVFKKEKCLIFKDYESEVHQHQDAAEGRRLRGGPRSHGCFFKKLLMENVLLFRLGKINIIGLGINDATFFQGDGHHLFERTLPMPFKCFGEEFMWDCFRFL